MDAHRRIEVGVVGVEHGAVVHAEREIGGDAAAGQEIHFDRAQRAVGLEAGVVVDAEIMALAGHDHVVVPVQPHLGGPAGDARG
jgi:hypothetical protein